MFALTLEAASGVLLMCGASSHCPTWPDHPRGWGGGGLSHWSVHLTETTQGPLAPDSSAKLTVSSHVFPSQKPQEKSMAHVCTNFYWRCVLGRKETGLWFRAEHWIQLEINLADLLE